MLRKSPETGTLSKLAQGIWTSDQIPAILRKWKNGNSLGSTCDSDKMQTVSIRISTLFPLLLFIMETVFACDLDTQDLRYVVYNNDENNAFPYNVFHLVTDAIWYIQNYKPVEL